MERQFLEAARNIENTGSLEGIFKILSDTLQFFDIPKFIYETVPDTPIAEPLIYSTLPDCWPRNGETLCMERNEEWFDPFLAYCCGTFEITKAGWEYLPDHDYVGAGSKAFIATLERFGIISGLAIPCRLKGTGRYGGFMLCSTFDRYRFERSIMPRAGQFQTFCLIAHRRIEDIAFDRKAILGQRPLSARERQCLDLVSRGLRAKEIAHSLGVSEASIRLYLKNARSKLGARTMEEAIVLALQSDLLRQ